MDLQIDLGTIASSAGALAIGVLGWLAKRAIDRADAAADADRKARAEHDAARTAQLAALEAAMADGNAAVRQDLTELRSELRSTAQLMARRLDEHDVRLTTATTSAQSQGERIGHVERDVAVLHDRDRRRTADAPAKPRVGGVGR